MAVTLRASLRGVSVGLEGDSEGSEGLYRSVLLINVEKAF